MRAEWTQSVFWIQAPPLWNVGIIKSVWFRADYAMLMQTVMRIMSVSNCPMDTTAVSIIKPYRFIIGNIWFSANLTLYIAEWTEILRGCG